MKVEPYFLCDNSLQVVHYMKMSKKDSVMLLSNCRLTVVFINTVQLFYFKQKVFSQVFLLTVCFSLSLD